MGAAKNHSFADHAPTVCSGVLCGPAVCPPESGLLLGGLSGLESLPGAWVIIRFTSPCSPDSLTLSRPNASTKGPLAFLSHKIKTRKRTCFDAKSWEMGSSLWTGGWPREEGQVGYVGRERGKLCRSQSQPPCAWILGPPVGIEGTDALLPPQHPPSR